MTPEVITLLSGVLLLAVFALVGRTRARRDADRDQGEERQEERS